ncbi:eCIS core domain-containing protein [Bradyrhizobium japonicum]|uniref:eCIS core domain-containing protein n=1 Tax=Bradyrhizobium japonicum TaxID=375 RepID=UPI0020A05EFA|nr:DUF4157 domain-containing protein [Bradyrhizobium japonicum]MCP1768648.1 hypothetical protein [Bradyrhizobium japonicum]MCP1794318.1 hypothetical protein [Bradyrhizobium japonicum]MCP1810926.1 hypothetical protein [Bradyrhizobium japonicum]MCP1821221.1 hypothetical protein [Bradyrhizobium japonicum]MCP1876257.1 hypothetical protein [Bradyrhizobium japonicum]
MSKAAILALTLAAAMLGAPRAEAAQCNPLAPHTCLPPNLRPRDPVPPPLQPPNPADIRLPDLTLHNIQEVFAAPWVLNARIILSLAGVTNGPQLAEWFQRSRDSAYPSSQPIPPDIRQFLQQWYSPAILNLARFKVGDGGAINLAGTLLRAHAADAVVLIDVIVFANQQAAQDWALWAHEVKHVEQFAQMGVDNFANAYISNYTAIENPAEQMQSTAGQALNAGHYGSQSMDVMPQQARVCVVGPQPYQRCSYDPTTPINTVCTCDNQPGLYGRIIADAALAPGGGYGNASPNTPTAIIPQQARVCVVGPQPYQRCSYDPTTPINAVCTCNNQPGLYGRIAF